MKVGNKPRLPKMTPIPEETMLVLVDEAVDTLALRVAALPDYPLTVTQRDRLEIIARELVRKARS